MPMWANTNHVQGSLACANQFRVGVNSVSTSINQYQLVSSWQSLQSVESRFCK